MKTFASVNPGSLEEAASLAREAIEQGQSVSFAGGGTDLLQLIKDKVVNRPGSGEPDVIVNLKAIEGLDTITSTGSGVSIGGLASLSAVSESSTVREQFAALAEAAESVATLQMRNLGTLAGNVVQRPWCWYYRNGFPCYKAGGDQCFSMVGENQLHAIFGGGPSFIVHPSDTAPALTAFEARFRVVGPAGERVVPASEFFVLPRVDAEHENVLADDEILASIEMDRVDQGTRSTYRKVMDRKVWTHALAAAAAVLSFDDQNVCRSARVVLGGVAPIPWRVEQVEALLIGEPITPELARDAGVAAVAGANPLPKNGYKVPMVRGLVERTLLELSASA